MKKLFALLALLLPMLAVTGCDPFPSSDEDDGEVEFVNKSKYRVAVIPESRGWSGFSLASGERKTIYDVYDVYFSHEPRFRVQVGKNESGKIVFVNGNPDATEVKDD